MAFPMSLGGRHMGITQCGGWEIQNTHLESGGGARARDAREVQMRQLCDRQSPVSVSEDAVHVLAGDFNLRGGEEGPLQPVGWRDAWQWPELVPGEDWTWSGYGRRLRFDRVFVRDAQDGTKVERRSIARLSGLCPAYTDHVALHAVLVRLPCTSGEEAP